MPRVDDSQKLLFHDEEPGAGKRAGSAQRFAVFTTPKGPARLGFAL